MAGAKGRSGGPRAGKNGRPRTRPPKPPPAPPPVAIPWHEIERHAIAGAPEKDIRVAYGITDAMLQDREAAARFKSTLERGHARYRLELRTQIKTRGTKTTKNAGSVNALALQARNHLDWDRQTQEQQLAPDLVGARERLRDTFVRMAASRSETEGRVITPGELIYGEAFAGPAAESGSGS